MKTFSGRKLGRTTSHRHALLRSLAESLLHHERIQTTFPKAKEASRYTEKIISIAKREGLAHRRQVSRWIHQKDVIKKLFEVLVPRYQSRNGGYTQVTRSGRRTGDDAPMAVIRLLP